MRHQARGFPRDLERKLRSSQTDAERIVWGIVRGRRLDGLKFRRQHPIGDRILDFYCPELRLALELDGKRHYTETGILHDQLRDETLLDLGVHVLRFENKDVIASPSVVAAAVRAFVGRSKT